VLSIRRFHEFWPISDRSFRLVARAEMRRPLDVAARIDRGREDMPGDGLVPEPDLVVTRRLGIAAPLGHVWPWLVQVMRGGGMYGVPALESARCRSADHLLEGLPEAREGDRIGNLLVLAELVPGRATVWRSLGRMDLLDSVLRDLSLAYEIRPAGPTRTDLRIRLRGVCWPPSPALASHLLRLIDRVLPCRQCERLRDLAERSSGVHRRWTTDTRDYQHQPLHPAGTHPLGLVADPQMPGG